VLQNGESNRRELSTSENSCWSGHARQVDDGVRKRVHQLGRSGSGERRVSVRGGVLVHKGRSVLGATAAVDHSAGSWWLVAGGWEVESGQKLCVRGTKRVGKWTNDAAQRRVEQDTWVGDGVQGLVTSQDGKASRERKQDSQAAKRGSRSVGEKEQRLWERREQGGRMG